MRNEKKSLATILNNFQRRRMSKRLAMHKQIINDVCTVVCTVKLS